MRSSDITPVVARLCIEANIFLPDDVKDALLKYYGAETFPCAKDILSQIIKNFHIAEENSMPVCQDTGMACVFVEIGEDLHIEGSLLKAINEGVRQGYTQGFLRKSVVADPLRRVNTNDNTPALIYTEFVRGDKLKITVAPKGFGSENMSGIKMLSPADGRQGVVDFVLETVRRAGANPCPPIVVGIGLGGSFDKAAFLAKKALLRPLNEWHSDPYYAGLEKEILEKINALGIGPQGFGGGTTALKTAIEVFPTHIAGLPCAVNINCHACRHKTAVLT